jgi:hypothetical protein
MVKHNNIQPEPSMPNVPRPLLALASAFLLVSIGIARPERRADDQERSKEKPGKTWDQDILYQEGSRSSSDSLVIREGSRSSSDSLVIRVTQPKLPGEVHNATPDEQRRLRVQWLEAIEVADSRREYLKHLLVRGKLLLEAPDGKTRKPVDWVQGILVVLARSAGENIDWKKHPEKKNAVRSACVPASNGNFEVSFEPIDLNRVVGKAVPFQAAINLGERSGQTITWRSTKPVLPQTVGALQVPGPKPLTRTQQLLVAAPWPSSQFYDAVALVRAVNHLHGLGKQKAIGELRAFMKIADGNLWRKAEPDNIDTSNMYSIALVIRLLFERAESGLAAPTIPLEVFSPPPNIEVVRWPYYPLSLQQDIPFFLVNGSMLGNVAYPRRFVDWAEKDGRLRTSPLHPPADPLAAVDALLAGAPLKRLLGNNKNKVPAEDAVRLRRQAWQMIEPIVGPWQTSDRDRQRSGYDADADWEKHKKIAARFKIHWDEQRQEYVAR